MNLMAMALGVAVVASLLAGGRVSRLTDADLRWTVLLLVGFGLQAFVDWATPREYIDTATATTVHLASFAFIIGWLVLNRHLRGTILVLLGFALNAAVITANGAMPVDLDALRAVGIASPTISLGTHEVMTDQTLLPVLADVHPIIPIRTMISVGDVVLTAGLIPLVHNLMTSSSPTARRQALRRDPQVTSAG